MSNSENYTPTPPPSGCEKCPVFGKVYENYPTAILKSPDSVKSAVVCPGTYREIGRKILDSGGDLKNFSEFSAGLADVCPNLNKNPNAQTIDTSPTIAVDGPYKISYETVETLVRIDCNTDEEFLRRRRSYVPLF